MYLACMIYVSLVHNDGKCPQVGAASTRFRILEEGAFETLCDASRLVIESSLSCRVCSLHSRRRMIFDIDPRSSSTIISFTRMTLERILLSR